MDVKFTVKLKKTSPTYFVPTGDENDELWDKMIFWERGGIGRRDDENDVYKEYYLTSWDCRLLVKPNV